MSKITVLWNNKGYQKWLLAIEAAEAERRFCRHGREHLQAVARITYILVLENNLGPKISLPLGENSREALRETVYAAGLTHDLGRVITYQSGGDHALESARLALPLLEKAGFSEPEIEVITTAVREHRNKFAGMSILGELLYRADKLSRPCAACEAAGECNKIEEMRLIQQFGYY